MLGSKNPNPVFYLLPRIESQLFWGGVFLYRNNWRKGQLSVLLVKLVSQFHCPPGRYCGTNSNIMAVNFRGQNSVNVQNFMLLGKVEGVNLGKKKCGNYQCQCVKSCEGQKHK